jgi:hypothetical protein
MEMVRIFQRILVVFIEFFSGRFYKPWGSLIILVVSVVVFAMDV